MKKKRLKGWVKRAIGIIITTVIMLIMILVIIKRVEFFNNNIEKCGNNYCERR